MAWAMMVAYAAPAIPILKPKMKIGSKIMLVNAPKSMVIMAIFGRPSARIKLFMAKAII